MTKNYYQGYARIKADLSKGTDKPPRWHWVHVIDENSRGFFVCERLNKYAETIEKGANTQSVHIIQLGCIKEIRGADLNRTYGEFEEV